MLDISDRLGGLETDLAGTDASRHAFFRRFLAELASRSLTTVAVIEDAHWADEATLDLVRFVSRRLRDARGLLIVTYRDDELGPSP